VSTILAIETSCDETAIAILRDRRLLASEIASQIAAHRPYGGVVPEIASRSHVENLPLVLDAALASASISIEDVNIFAATCGPGLASSLLTGFTFAKAMAAGAGKPFIAVNHIEAHLLSPFFESHFAPCIALVVSGGHTLLVEVHGVGKYTVLETTRDDAAGEAFDKAAKLAGLPYPGGPEIDKLAKLGNPRRFDLPRSMIKDRGFSFSGLKTAVRYMLPEIGPNDLADLCASFQVAVVDVLVAKSLRALKETGRDVLAVSGGVACNSGLRARLENDVSATGATLLLAQPSLTTDNAAMIAWTAALRLEAGIDHSGDLALDIDPNLKLVAFA
jgi:N6-L-threonylcarbamoyladenine synthase